MASILLEQTALSNLKQEIKSDLSDLKSSHIFEALAAAIGFKTYAALKSHMSKNNLKKVYYLLDESVFAKRLT